MKKLFSEIVFDVTSLEGNPFTFPQVQTLLDGITVGGQKISDADLYDSNDASEIFSFMLTQQITNRF